MSQFEHVDDDGRVWKIGGPDGLNEEIIEFLTDFFANGGKIHELFPDDERFDDDDNDDLGSDDEEGDDDEEVVEDEEGSNLDAVDDEAEEAGEVGGGDDSEDEEENKLENADPNNDFNDSKFLSRNESYEGKEVTWSAPENPVFIVDGLSLHDVKQGGIGNCWFMSSLSSLAARQERISKVIMQAENVEKGQEAGYTFKFFKLGKWFTYRVDKMLPSMSAGQSDNEVWIAYCEKAYAKRYKSYENITGGWGAWGLTDISGGVSIVNKLKWGAPGINQLFMFIYNNQKDFVCTSGIVGGTGGGAGSEVLKDNGLYEGHEYSFLKADMVHDANGKINRLVQIRNPWGSGEWKGDWSDNSDKWNDVPNAEQYNVKREDGAFWMSWKDYVSCFTDVTLCKLPTKYSDEANGRIFEHQKAFQGKYESDSDANQTFRLTIEGGRTNVFFQVMFDCCIKDSMTQQYHVALYNLKTRKKIFPNYPFNFENEYANTVIAYQTNNGYMWNLKSGTYQINFGSYVVNPGEGLAPSVVPGRRWMVRAISPKITSFKKS